MFRVVKTEESRVLGRNVEVMRVLHFLPCKLNSPSVTPSESTFQVVNVNECGFAKECGVMKLLTSSPKILSVTTLLRTL